MVVYVVFLALFISGYQIRWSGIEHTYSIVFHGLVIMAYLAIYSRIQVNNESKRVRLIMSTTNSAAKLMNADDRKEIERYFVCKNQLQYLEKPLKF